MRDDMANVVTERPRRGHGNKSKKTTGRSIRRYDPDRDYDEATRLPVARGRQDGYEAKEFSDLINPLRRYLRSCIGRPHAERRRPGLARSHQRESARAQPLTANIRSELITSRAYARHAWMSSSVRWSYW